MSRRSHSLRPVTLLALAWALRAGAGEPPAVSAPPAAPDEQRTAWRYRRVLAPPPPGALYAVAELPPELRAHAQPDLRDLRVVDAQGQDVPVLVELQSGGETSRTWPGRLIDTRREAERRTWWLVDLGETRVFERVQADVNGSDFAKRVRLEGSDDGRAWHLLAEGGLFERAWGGGRVRHTAFDLAAPASARYLRLTADDRRSAPVDLTAVEARGVRFLAESRWSREVRLSSPRTQAGLTRYALELPPGLPLETFEIEADEAAFWREARLVENPDDEVRRRVLGSARLYRVRSSHELPGGAALRGDVQRPGGGPLALEMLDGDNPPLRGLRLRASGRGARLLFAGPAPAEDWPLWLYYGNASTRAAFYDLEQLRERLRAEAVPVPVALGAEQPNPRFVAAPPLALVASAGAALEAHRWRRRRLLRVTAAEDLYGLVLEATDLGALRPDLGDLRIADAGDRQVPYVLESAARHEFLDLRAEPAARGRRKLALPAPQGAAAPAVPLESLELEFAEGFFTRPVRVWGPATPPATGERRLYQGVLRRIAERQAPQQVPLGGVRLSALWLEVDDGDNAPLTLVRARVRVSVPRLTFKAAAGEYRLLLDNPAAEPPRYDLASLRREVLDYSAVPLPAGPLEPNPGARRGAATLLDRTPPSLVLWAALGAAVLGLLALTVRLLRQAGE